MNGRMRIRAETAQDIQAIHDVTAAAFADHPYSRQTEQFIIAALRRAGALTISLVAEEAGAVVGHVAFSPVEIDGRDIHWMGLGPIAVRPDHQRRGVGTALVRTGLEAARAAGAQGCALVGDPHFYGRFGFRAHPGLTFAGVPPEYFMALSLASDGHLPHGAVTHHPAFTAEA